MGRHLCSRFGCKTIADVDAPYDASTGMATFHDIFDIVLTATKEEGKINIKLQIISGDKIYLDCYGSKPIS